MDRTPVESSCLRSLGYDGARRLLEVEFQSGALYQYEEVSPEVVRELLAADSLGRHFNRIFKAYAFPYRRLDRSPT